MLYHFSSIQFTARWVIQPQYTSTPHTSLFFTMHEAHVYSAKHAMATVSCPSVRPSDCRSANVSWPYRSDNLWSN